MSLYKTLKDFRKREKEKKGRWYLDNKLGSEQFNELLKHYKINGFSAADGGEVKDFGKVKDVLYAAMARDNKIMISDESS